MPKCTPSYRQRSGSDQAIVTLMDATTRQRRDYWLGLFGTTESRERYHRLIAEWEARGRILPDADDRQPGSRGVTIEELIASYWRWASSYYANGEVNTIQMAMKLLGQFYGSTPASEFGPNRLRVVREQMIRGSTTENSPRRPWMTPGVPLWCARP